eukprot:919203-Rhodomonas_salina.2
MGWIGWQAEAEAEGRGLRRSGWDRDACDLPSQALKRCQGVRPGGQRRPGFELTDRSCPSLWPG